MSTSITLAIAVLVLTAVLWAVFLHIGLKWAKVRDVSTGRLIVVTLLAITTHVAIHALFWLVVPDTRAGATIALLAEFLIGIVIVWAIIAVVCKARFLRAIQAWLPTLIPVFPLPLLMVFIFLKPYYIPTSAMSPTLLGEHVQGTCAECGRQSFCSPPRVSDGQEGTSLMICENFHVTEVAEVVPSVMRGDRVLVDKFKNPKRWDVAIFQYPADPSVLFAMRVVGLPGEEIVIKEGTIWADGEKLTPPDSLAGIEYVTEMNEMKSGDLWGSKARPAVLGEGEYFVLGDFSKRSNDSRLWFQGAAGHPAYAVPESHMRGVITHIYWPPKRWRILR